MLISYETNTLKAAQRTTLLIHTTTNNGCYDVCGLLNAVALLKFQLSPSALSVPVFTQGILGTYAVLIP